MTIPLIIFLYLYLLIIVVILLFGMFNIYHVIRFSFWDAPAFIASFLFLAAIALTLFISFEAIRQINWQQTIDLSRWIVTINPFDDGALNSFIE
ncbi:MAG: hypothetical protein AAB817_00725 [Patescibacteria group bacterium]